MKKLISLFVVLGLVSTSVGQQPWIKPTPLNNFGPALTDSIFGISSTSEADPTGDTYTVAPLLQSGGIPATGAGFANDLGVVGVTFDGLAESGGVNVFGNAGDTFIAIEFKFNFHISLFSSIDLFLENELAHHISGLLTKGKLRPSAVHRFCLIKLYSVVFLPDRRFHQTSTATSIGPS